MKILHSFIFAVACAMCACVESDDADLTATLEPEVTAPTAQQWDKDVVGWNLGNSLECPTSGSDNELLKIDNPSGSMLSETVWGNPKVTRELIKTVKSTGFNAIRIPIRWQHHITHPQTMAIDSAWLARVKEIVGWCQEEDLKVIINTHLEKWLESQPYNTHKTDNCEKLRLLWTNIATAFKDYDYTLAFAGTNEVHVPDNWAAPTSENLSVQNSYNQAFIDAVRATGGNNVKRHLIVQTYACNPDYGIYGGLIVPTDLSDNGKKYMSVEFHYYNPYDYCGGQSGCYYYWGTQYQSYGTISPSGNETTMFNYFNKVVSTWANQGLGIVIGEWGVSNHYILGQEANIHANMTYYCNYFVTKAKASGFATFVWDNNNYGNGDEKFGIIDRSNNSVKATWITKGIF